MSTNQTPKVTSKRLERHYPVRKEDEKKRKRGEKREEGRTLGIAEALYQGEATRFACGLEEVFFVYLGVWRRKRKRRNQGSYGTEPINQPPKRSVDQPAAASGKLTHNQSP